MAQLVGDSETLPRAPFPRVDDDYGEHVVVYEYPRDVIERAGANGYPFRPANTLQRNRRAVDVNTFQDLSF